jgi:hypothetical protein
VLKVLECESNCTGCNMAILNITDRAHEFRITITGKLSGDSVHELERIWKAAIADSMHRGLTVDISALAGYDAAGCRLLRKINAHGARFAASNSASLVWLGEISTPQRRGPALVVQKPAEPASSRPARKAAAGHK